MKRPLTAVMGRFATRYSLGLALMLAVTWCTTVALADPLPGRDVLKFQQRPLDNLTYPVGDPVNGFQNMTYWGHDNISTAYSRVTPDQKIVYDGRFMADDFADLFNTPVVHVKWWGSYPVIGDGIPVDKFLISFEEDVPADPSIPGSFSHPGQPLLNQIVTRGPLAPSSGTFTETPFSPGGPPLFEQVFEYNAELNLGKEFQEKADTVYWLKIVALVDVPPGAGPIDPNNPPPFLPQWGWHNRDYSITNPYASTSPNVVPGEYLDGFLNPTPAVAVYHFQDDAVEGGVFIDPTGIVMPDGNTMPLVQQDVPTMRPTHYLDDIDGPGVTGLSGPIVMSTFSQDLAFELYTTVPEPSSLMLLLGGILTAAGRSRRHATLANEHQ